VFGNRNNRILIGVALAAFLAFTVFSESGGSFWSRLLHSFSRGSAGSSRVAPAHVGAPGTTAAPGGKEPKDDSGAPARGSLRAKSAKKSDPTLRRPPDPNLVRRLGGGEGLVPITPPQSLRDGIVRQTFRASKGPVASGAPSASNGGGSTPTAPEPSPSSPSNCGPAILSITVIDLKKNPNLQRAFDVPSLSPLIQNDLGERFQIGAAPAYVIYYPAAKTGSAGAIFDERFLVSIRGNCIPSRAFLKKQLIRR
jgi:hypothetical protein